jgi:hypothetical protein
MSSSRLFPAVLAVAGLLALAGPLAAASPFPLPHASARGAAGLVGAAAVPANDPLSRRWQEIADAVCSGLAEPSAVFAPVFLSKVPPAQIAMILQQYCAQGGPVQTVTEVSRQGASFAELVFHTEHGCSYPVKIGKLLALMPVAIRLLPGH